MAHIYAIDKLLNGDGIPDNAKAIAKKMHELDKIYNRHSTPYLIGEHEGWTFACYTDHRNDPQVVIYRTIDERKYTVTTLSFGWASKVFPEFALADWEYWVFTGDDFMCDGEWAKLE